MIQLDERGKQCPIPIVETKRAIEGLEAGQVVETIVDNEISAQNLKKFADQRKYAFELEKVAEGEFRARLTVTGEAEDLRKKGQAAFDEADYQACDIQAAPVSRDYIVAVSSDHMGEPEEELGRILLKGFLYALSKKDQAPRKILFYNGGARLTCRGSESLEDIRELEKSGSEILTCGTCLKFQGLEDQLQIGSVTNMYEITEALTGPTRVVKPC